ncbi:hypothetical protein F511_04893 [Dorcoceras hygrometricum]|uniref:DUF7804 domain-containing protein n=1 Tax=Dorcoceras hygrometricum TaxID=472368 RepID=A0A2Z7BK95_9LAMI|nr:hypothetical protein F511_04893 [Dorcoceras hygrometricum]
MMAVANGIQPRGNMANSPFLRANKSNQICFSNPCLPTFTQNKKSGKRSLSVSFSLSHNSAIVSSPTDDVLKGADISPSKDSFSSEKIDYWIQESVADIVKNLKKSPLLVQIHAEKNGFGEQRRLKFNIENAILENWDFLKSEWENGGSKTPDAVVFVEELEENPDQELGEGVNRVWGIVVQGKGVECVPRCYLLKTNRICGGLGLGFCTHFCLMRVMDFRESALGQFKDCWLLQ